MEGSHSLPSVVATPSLKNRLDQFIRRGETLWKIVASSAETTIEMSVPEKEACDVAPGFPVAVKVNSYLVFQLATRRAISWVRTEFWTWLP